MGQAEQSDEDLLVEARRDPSAFGPLYDRHVDELLGFFARRTAEALVQACEPTGTMRGSRIRCHDLEPGG